MKYKKRLLGALLAPLAASLVQPVVSSVIKGISGRGFRRAGRGYADKNFWCHSTPIHPQFRDY